MLISVCLYATLIAIETLLDGLFPSRIDMLQLYAMNQILIVIISVVLFAMFSCIQLRCIPQINKISKHTIGVYLVHDNQLIGSFLVWGVMRKLFHVTELYEKGSMAFIPISIIVVFLVFGGGYIIDWTREKFVGKLIEKMSAYFANCLRVYFDKGMERLK